jgi:hypothetical protein
LLRYTLDGKPTWMGLGKYPDVSLKRAREKAQDARALKADGRDPLEHKRAVRATVASHGPVKSMTFQECALDHIKRHEPGWTPKYSQQQAQLLADYAFPHIGSKGVSAITTQDILKVLQPIWSTMPVSASRLRNRIELVLDAARAAGHSVAENPARWRGHLDKLLARPSKIAAVEHHPALHYRDVPALVEQLRQRDAISAQALAFIALTACRASECLGMTWGEVDLEQQLWTIPAARMKGRRVHRVPLSDQAVELLGEKSSALDLSARIFPISLAALDQLRLRIGMDRSGSCSADPAPLDNYS